MNEDKVSQQVWDKTAEWVDGIGLIINELAKQLGVAAEHVYTVYATQMFMEGLVTTIMLTCFTALAVVTSIYLVKVAKKLFSHEDYRRSEGVQVGSFFALVGAVVFPLIMVLIVAINLPEALMKMLNPEYYTIKDLLSMVKNMSQ